MSSEVPDAGACEAPWSRIGGACQPPAPVRCETERPSVVAACAAPWPCPAGWMESEDGCAPVETRCPEGERALPGGVCLALARCPDGTRQALCPPPEPALCPAGASALPGGCTEVWVCPNTWTRSPPGDRSCAPVYDACPEGTLALSGGGCEALGFPDCEAHRWAEVAWPEDTLFVRADADAELADGSRERPFVDLMVAAERLQEGGTLGLGPGVHPVLDLVLPAGSRLGGVCGDVRIEGQVLTRAPDVWIHDLSVHGRVSVRRTGRARLDRLDIRIPESLGLAVAGHAEASHLRIRGGILGAGVQAGGQLDCRYCLFEDLQVAAVSISGEGSETHLRHTHIKEVSALPGTQGHGIEVEEGAALYGSDLRVTDTEHWAVLVLSGAEARLERFSAELSGGVVAADGGQVVLRDAAFSGLVGPSMMVLGEGSRLEAQRVRVIHLEHKVDRDIDASGGAQLEVSDLENVQPALFGVHVSSGAQATLRRLTILDGAPSAEGIAVLAAEGGVVDIQGARLERPGGASLVARGGQLNAQSVAIEGDPESTRVGRLRAEAGGQLRVRGLEVSDLGDQLLATTAGEGSLLDLSEAWFVSTPAEARPPALVAEDAASLVLARVAFAGTGDEGVTIRSDAHLAGSDLRLPALRIEEASAALGQSRVGVLEAVASELTLLGSEVETLGTEAGASRLDSVSLGRAALDGGSLDAQRLEADSAELRGATSSVADARIDALSLIGGEASLDRLEGTSSSMSEASLQARDLRVGALDLRGGTATVVGLSGAALASTAALEAERLRLETIEIEGEAVLTELHAGRLSIGPEGQATVADASLGALGVAGRLDASQLRISGGDAEVSGAADLAQVVLASGALKVSGTLTARQLVLLDAPAEALECSGEAEVDQLLVRGAGGPAIDASEGRVVVRGGLLEQNGGGVTGDVELTGVVER